MEKSVFIVIPAYNEEKMIGKVIRELKENNYNNIIVVDDGSKDSTSKIVESLNTNIITHIINRGQGAALQTGTEYALRKGADIIVHFDADGQFKAEEIKNITQPIVNEEVEVTLGSRFLGTAVNIPHSKKITLKLGILFTYFFSGLKLTDTHNGFRALSRDAAQKILITQDKMAHASEIVDEIKKKKIKFKEIPVTVIYSEYSKKKGQSIFNSIKIAFNLIIKKLAK